MKDRFISATPLALCLIVTAIAVGVIAGALGSPPLPPCVPAAPPSAERIRQAEYVANAADGNKVGVLVRALEVLGQ
jgi:hypothetical protein